jgi:hypothetical protein
MVDTAEVVADAHVNPVYAVPTTVNADTATGI